MKLDRNINANGRGKYALLKLRKLAEINTPGTAGYMRHEAVNHAIKLLKDSGILDWGDTPDTAFFVMRLKDKNAASGLYGYANAAQLDDPEYAAEIEKLAARAGPHSPFCKRPD